MRLKRFVIVGVVGVSLTLLSLIVFRQIVSPSTEINLSEYPGSSENAHSVIYKDNYYFSNGRGFVKINLVNEEKTVLGKPTELPQVYDLQISPDEKHIAFRTTKQALEINKFSNTNKNSFENTSFWWTLDLSSNKLTSLVTDSSHQLVWLSNSEFVYAEGPVLQKKNINNNDPGTTLAVLPSSINSFRIYEDEILVHSQQNTIHRLSLQTEQLETVREGVSPVIFSSQKDCYLELVSDEPVDSSYASIVGCGTGGLRVDKPDIASYAFYELEGEKGLLYTDRAGLFFLRFRDNKTIRINSPIKPSETNSVWQSSPDESSVLLISNGRYYGVNKIDIYSPISTNVSAGEDFVIDFVEPRQEVVATKQSDFIEADKSQVNKIISAQGFDPDLMYVKYEQVFDPNYRW